MPGGEGVIGSNSRWSTHLLIFLGQLLGLIFLGQQQFEQLLPLIFLGRLVFERIPILMFVGQLHVGQHGIQSI